MSSARWPADRPLTEAQSRLVACVVSYRATHSHGPTLSELAAALGQRSVSGVWQALHSLRRRGVVTWAEVDGRVVARTLAVREDWASGRLAG